MKLWLDDVRPAPNGWIWVTNVVDAKRLFLTKKVIEISFDHDLGEDSFTGYDLANWIEKSVYENDFSMPIWNIHSANPVGRSNIERAMKNAEKIRL